MTSDDRGSAPRYNRPSSSMRRQTLGGGGAEHGGDDAAGDGRPLRDLLAEIPDLDGGAPAPQAQPESAARREAPRIRPPAPTGRRDAPATATKRRAAAPASASVADRGDRDATGELETYERVRKPLWRRIIFSIVLMALLASIPLLAYEGYQLVANSKSGKSVNSELTREDPNFIEAVESTPTALVAQTNEKGDLVALTVLAQSGPDAGTIIFIPVDTEYVNGYGQRTSILKAFEGERRAADMGPIVGDVLNVGIDQTFVLDDRSFKQVLAPVGTLTFDNPDPMTLPDGTELAGGEVTIGPPEIGPYLAHLGEGENQLSQYARHQLVWQAWLKAVAENPGDRAPGDNPSSIDPFLRHLSAAMAKNQIRIVNLNGDYDESGTFIPDQALNDAMMLDAVPVPDASRPGARFTLEVLNGVKPGAPPTWVVRSLVAMDGTILNIGNGPKFGQDTTKILYAAEEFGIVADFVRTNLGIPNAELVLDPNTEDRANVTVVMGKDILDADGPPVTTSAPATTSTAPTPTTGEP